MRFLEDNQIAEWLENARIPGPAGECVFRAYFGQQANPRGREREVATEALENLERWDECLIEITLWGVWSSSEDWPKYYAMRGEEGERRSLEVAPGHLFASSERDKLLRFLIVVLENAWDARALPALEGTFTGRRLIVSHDEWVEVRVATP